MKRRIWISVALVFLLGTLNAPARGQASLRITPVLQWTITTTGQPILFPLYQNQLVSLILEILPGGRNGRHQHLFPPFAYMLEGTMTLEMQGHGQRAFAPGQAFVEGVDNWDEAFNRGTTPIKALVVFPAEEGQPTRISSPESKEVGVGRAPVLSGTATMIGQPIQFPRFRNQVTAQLWEMAPGGETGRHKYLVPTLVYMLNGTLTLEIEGKGQIAFTAGQAFLGDIDTWHNGRNVGATPVKALVGSFGEEGKPVLIRP